MGIFSLFSITGCSLIKKDTDKANSAVVLKIGDLEMTKSDVTSAFYTYYQNNSSYFSYYDESVIEESFYQWLIVRQLVSDYSLLALYGDDNTEGFEGHITYYTKEDAEDVWNYVLEYFYTQVSDEEKIIYAADENYGEDTNTYPVWIRDSEEEEENTVFEPFVSSASENDNIDRDTSEDNLATKLTEDEVKSKIQALKEYLFQYVPDENNLDEDDNPVRVAIDETNYIKNARQQAYLNYLADLISSAKNNGTSVDLETVFENEVVRVYEAYYNSKVSTIFQNYFLYEYLTDTENGDKVSLGNAAIAKAFITKYYYDKQSYSSESGYISVMESEDGASLVLYYFNGVYYYFSVQHILLNFSDYVSNLVKEIDEYNSSSDYETVVSDAYKKERDDIANDHEEAILTTVNKDNEFGSIALFGNYYYYDEDCSELYGNYYYTLDEDTKLISIVDEGTDGAEQIEIYGGYIKLSDYTYLSENNELTYTNNDLYDVYETEAVLMATYDDVIECIEKTYPYWCGIIDSYISALKSDNETQISEIKEAHEDMEYIFDVVQNMYESESEMSDIYLKMYSLLFVELEWVYSGDSLKNEISNKIGYIISNEKGNNGSWVSEFAIGSREMLELLQKYATTESSVSDENGGNYTVLQAIALGKYTTTGDETVGVSSLTQKVISDYGIHIIKVENIYECGKCPIDIEAVIENYGGEVDYTNTEFVDEVIALLKSSYVSTSSNETLYDYFYEILYTNYVGSSSSSGTYFLAIEYKWLSTLYVENKIVYVNKMSYSDLTSSIS